MEVVNVNEGRKVDWLLEGTKITFGDDEITINLKKYQKDFDICVDVVETRYGNLAIGAGDNAVRYVAQIEIAKAEYEEKQSDDESQNEKVKKDIDMSKVTLKLWSLD